MAEFDASDIIFGESENSSNAETSIIADSNDEHKTSDFADPSLNISRDRGNMITEFINEESDVQGEDEEFCDAVQFFKDPASFKFLESAGSSNSPTEPLMTRSSLYANFDPLYAKFFSKPAILDELKRITGADIESEVPSDDIIESDYNLQSDIVPDVVYKHLPDVIPQEFIGNAQSNENQMSFDSTEKEQLSQTDETSFSLTVSDNYTEMSELSSDMWLDRLDKMLKDVRDHNDIIHSAFRDLENNIDPNLILNFSSDFGAIISEFSSKEEKDVQVKDEEFYDAAQLFKDPSSLALLESAGSANSSAEPLMTRSSLYINFDPLYAKFFPQNEKSNELKEMAKNDMEPEMSSDGNAQNDTTNAQNDTTNKENDIIPDDANSDLDNVSPGKTSGKFLISLDSPISSKDIHSRADDNELQEAQKLYAEAKFQQVLNIEELTQQETFPEKQQNLELAGAQKLEEMEEIMQEQQRPCSAFHCLLKDVSVDLSVIENGLQEKLAVPGKESEKLKEDLKTAGGLQIEEFEISENENERLKDSKTTVQSDTASKQNDVIPGDANNDSDNVSPGKTSGKFLISLDSTVSSTDIHSRANDNELQEAQKLYAEEKFQQVLKIQEVTPQETFPEKQQNLELAGPQKPEEMEEIMQEQPLPCSAFHCLLKDVSIDLSVIENGLREKLAVPGKESEKLKEDLKTAEGLQIEEFEISENENEILKNSKTTAEGLQVKKSEISENENERLKEDSKTTVRGSQTEKLEISENENERLSEDLKTTAKGSQIENLEISENENEENLKTTVEGSQIENIEISKNENEGDLITTVEGSQIENLEISENENEALKEDLKTTAEGSQIESLEISKNVNEDDLKTTARGSQIENLEISENVPKPPCECPHF